MLAEVDMYITDEPPYFRPLDVARAEIIYSTDFGAQNIICKWRTEGRGRRVCGGYIVMKSRFTVYFSHK